MAGGELRRRDRVTRHKLLGENLAALQPSSIGRRAYESQAARVEGFAYADDQRRFGADDGEVGFHGLGEVSEAARVIHVGGQAGGEVGDAGIAGRAEELRSARRLFELPAER